MIPLPGLKLLRKIRQLSRADCSYNHCPIEQYLILVERVWTLVQILTERSTESAERALQMEIGAGGLDLTPFARLVYQHPDGEVHFVQINVMLAQRQLPLRLAVAGFPRTPLDDGTCPRISEMQLVAVPAEMRRSSLVLTSGQVLFPFEDSPHITHDGCDPFHHLYLSPFPFCSCLQDASWDWVSASLQQRLLRQPVLVALLVSSSDQLVQLSVLEQVRLV